MIACIGLCLEKPKQWLNPSSLDYIDFGGSESEVLYQSYKYGSISLQYLYTEVSHNRISALYDRVVSLVFLFSPSSSLLSVH
jgi:hypothetical protein